MRILVVTKAADSGSARVRLGQLVPHFEAAGHEVRRLEWVVRGRGELLRRSAALALDARWADAILVQKPTQPPWLLASVARRAVLALDIDDAVWVGSAGTSTEASERQGRRLQRAARHARLVVTGSSWLAHEVATRAPGTRTEVLPSGLDAAAWDAARLSVPRARPPHVVWIGSAGNLRDLHPDFLDGLRPLVQDGSVRFEVICDEAPVLDDLAFVHVPWRLEEEARSLARATIGVMPLLDDERARGRCSYKAVQYLAAGIAVVASPVGGAVEVVRDDITGLVATTGAEWEAALRRLLGDASLRSRLVHEGHRMVAAAHDAPVLARRWLELLDEIGW